MQHHRQGHEPGTPEPPTCVVGIGRALRFEMMPAGLLHSQAVVQTASVPKVGNTLVLSPGAGRENLMEQEGKGRAVSEHWKEGSTGAAGERADVRREGEIGRNTRQGG